MSEEPQPIIIPIIQVNELFAAHLKQSNNKRILFSAPFGAGKSYFLHDYFEGNEDLLSIRLHPVDYSVANNEDIFELMKHDIISALIEKYGAALKLDSEDFSDLLLAQEFIRNRMELSGIGKAIVTALMPHGEELIKAGVEFKKLGEDFKDFKAEINPNQAKEIQDYLATLKNRKGSIRENDAITVIIKNYVNRIKKANGDKPFVFILDDLDRLDPEHLFRLFNVFTAHHDSKTDSNKFDFDQIIFVCDVKNIHHMFRHKYGKKVDFAGYIDKFYSSHIFYFDFKRYLKESVKTLMMRKYDFDEAGERHIPAYLYHRYDFKDTSHAKDWGKNLSQFIGNFIERDLIKIRSFERFRCYCVPMYQFYDTKGRNFYAYDFPFLVMIHILQQFFPRHYELEKALEVLSITYSPDYNGITGNYPTYDDEILNDWLMHLSIPFIMEPDKFSESRIEEKDDAYFECKNEYGELLEIHYSVNRDHTIRYSSTKTLSQSQPESAVKETQDSAKIEAPTLKSITVKRPNPYWFVLMAFRQCLKRNFLKN